MCQKTYIFIRWLFEMGGMGLDTAERCRRGFVLGSGVEVERRVGLDTAERCRRGFVFRSGVEVERRVGLDTVERCRRGFVWGVEWK